MLYTILMINGCVTDSYHITSHTLRNVPFPFPSWKIEAFEDQEA